MGGPAKKRKGKGHMSRIKVKRDRRQKRDNAIERVCEALLRKEAAGRRPTTLRFLWAFCAGLSSLALGLYHPAMAQDEPGRDRQPAPREPERGFGLWNTLPPIKPEPDSPADPLWPGDRDRNARGTSRLMAQQDFSGPPKQRFEIPAGQLGPALTVFSRQTELQLLYLSELVEGRTTTGVQGDYTPEDGLRALLSGTGLQYQFSDAKTVVLQPVSRSGDIGPSAPATPQAETKPVKVPEIVVKEKKERALVVDQPDGYKADVSSEAVLRFPARIQELPQSVSVVTKDSIRERRAVTQTQALEGVAGIGKTGQGAGIVVDDYVIRGFRVDERFPGFTRDNGLAAFNHYVADPALYERFEVIKGPASFTSGLVTAGGFVNRLLKAPQFENFVVGEAGAGSHGHYRTTLDANGVMPNLPVAGRFVFAHNEDPEFFRNTGNQRFSFLPSVRFTPREDFTVTVTANVQRLRGKGYYGTPTTTQGLIPAGIEDSFLGNDNRLKLDYHGLYVEADKRFVQGLRLKVKGQYGKDETSYRYSFGYVYPPAQGIGPDGNFSIYAYGRDFKRESFAGEVNLTKDFSLFGNNSSVSAGMDYSMGRRVARRTGFPFLGPGNVASPENNLPFPPGFNDPATDFFGNTRFNQTGAFAQGLLRPFAGTTLMAALRGNWITQANFAETGDRTSGLNDSALTPQIGLSQRLLEGLNIYALYGESFQPNFGLVRSGETLDPMTGKTVEIGSKWEPFDKRVRFTAALFRTELDNVATPDPNNPFFVIGGQSQRNQGFEFEARGALIPRLEVNLAYTYLDTKFTASNDPRIIGTRAFNAPMHTVSAFGTYDFSDVLAKGLKLGAVVYYRGEVSAIPGRANQTYPDYTRFDLFALYAPLTWLSFQVNLNNLADARYVEGPFYHAGFNHFGAPRHVIGMVRMVF